MNRINRHLVPGLLALAAATAAPAASPRGFELTVLVDGVPRPEFAANGTLYVEALRGRDYTLRVSNPLPVRVAVALAVDGLNSIDAKRTDASSAAKWVLEPYGSTEIAGWQVNEAAARRFVFTTESRSYGAFLGKTENLGVIEAVFFKEKVRHPRPRPYEYQPSYRDKEESYGGLGSGRRDEPSASADGAPPGAPAPQMEQRSQSKSMAPPPADEYAATGMGDHTRHEVTRVSLDLETTPVAQVRIRYEFRQQLARLGILPYGRTPLDRREGASGFGSYAPEAPRRDGW